VHIAEELGYDLRSLQVQQKQKEVRTLRVRIIDLKVEEYKFTPEDVEKKINEALQDLEGYYINDIKLFEDIAMIMYSEKSTRSKQ